MHKKQELLLKISEIISEKGYERTSIRDIAAHVGMTNAGLYHYFESKEAILAEIMNYALDNALKAMNERLPKIKSAKDKLAWIIQDQIMFFVKNQSQSKALINEKGALKERHGKVIRKKNEEYVNLLRQVVKQILQESHNTAVDETAAIFILMEMMNGIVHWYKPEGRITPNELASIMVHIFLHGITGKSNVKHTRNNRD